MTVVAGYVDQKVGQVHLAADSVAVAGNGIKIANRKLIGLKVEGTGDVALFGAAGFTALGPLVHRLLSVDNPGHGGSLDGWAQATAEAVTNLALRHMLTDESDGGRVDMAILFAWRDRLWVISHHVAIPVEDYHAVGSGAAVAMGAMWALDADQRHEPSAIPALAVQATADHMVGIGGTTHTASTTGGITDG